MAERHLIFSRLAACSAIVLIAAGASCLVIGSSRHERAAIKADDWRRTADGWVRASEWKSLSVRTATNRQPPTAKLPAAASSRFDVHPATLALMQFVGALLALAMFAAPSPHGQSLASGLRSALAKSFRASAFGS